MKKSIIIFMLMLLPGSLLFSQVSVNSTGDPPHGSAMLDVSSTTKGFLLPRMTTAEMHAISNPATGLMIFNLDINKAVFFDGNLWSSFDGQDYCGLLFIDSRDGKVYSTIQIGTQCWMAENLNVGTRIDGAGDQTANGTIEKYCYNNLESNCNTYGGLYQWNEAMQYSTMPGDTGICPTGWHFPSDPEWTTLTTYINNQTSYLCNSTSEWIAKAMAATTLWNTSTNTCAIGNNLSLNNATGFSALPGGYRHYTGAFFYDIVNYGYLWSSTEYNTYAWYRQMSFQASQVGRNNTWKAEGHAVRCVRDY